MDIVHLHIPKAIQVLRLFNEDAHRKDPPSSDSPEWIDVSKNEPHTPGKYVLAWVKLSDGEILKAYYYYISFARKSFWIHRYRDDFLCGITHWMPMPLGDLDDNRKQ